MCAILFTIPQLEMVLSNPLIYIREISSGRWEPAGYSLMHGILRDAIALL